MDDQIKKEQAEFVIKRINEIKDSYSPMGHILNEVIEIQRWILRDIISSPKDSYKVMWDGITEDTMSKDEMEAYWTARKLVNQVLLAKEYNLKKDEDDKH